MSEDLNKIDNIQQSLNSSNKLAHALYEYEKALLEQPSSSIFQHGLDDRSNLKTLIELRGDKALFARKLVDRLKHNEEQMKGSHQERRKYIEQKIRILVPLEKYDLNKNADICNILSQAYYHRSLLFRPKDFHIPERKIEALYKGMEYCEKVLDNKSKPNQNNFSILKTWLLSYREYQTHSQHHEKMFLEPHKGKYRISEKTKLYMDRLKHFYKKCKIKDLNDISLILDYAREQNRTIDQTIAVNILNKNIKSLSKNSNSRSFVLCLYKARTQLYLKENSKISKWAEDAIRKSPKSFADPFWDELIAFIKELKQLSIDLWKPISISAWKKCYRQEEKIGNNVFLCWYWANQRELYDMAFSAVSSPVKKAIIADSVKSRSTLLLHVINELKKESDDPKIVNKLNEMIKQYNDSRDQNYLKGINSLEEIHFTSQSTKQVQPSDIDNHHKKDLFSQKKDDFEDIPDGWTVIHLYLNEMEKSEGNDGGHALIYNTKNKKWIDKTFDYRNLYQLFYEWQENYLKKNDGYSSDLLEAICKEMGQSMQDFLFSGKKDITGDNVLWRFLHNL
jgi:hypothetical protein